MVVVIGECLGGKPPACGEAGAWLRQEDASEGVGEGALEELGEVLRVEASEAWRLCTGTYLEEVEGECVVGSVDSTVTRGMAIGLDIATE